MSAARAEAASRKLAGYAITLLRSSVEPFLTFSTRRDLRDKAFTAWIRRGDAGETDNKPLIREILALRAEYARLLGYRDFADMKLADSMAKTADNASRLLDEVWPAAKRRAARERDDLLRLARAGRDRPHRARGLALLLGESPQAAFALMKRPSSRISSSIA